MTTDDRRGQDIVSTDMIPAPLDAPPDPPPMGLGPYSWVGGAAPQAAREAELERQTLPLLDSTGTALIAEQEIRARALNAAAQTFAVIEYEELTAERATVVVLESAQRFAAWIADGSVPNG